MTVYEGLGWQSSFFPIASKSNVWTEQNAFERAKMSFCCNENVAVADRVRDRRKEFQRRRDECPLKSEQLCRCTPCAGHRIRDFPASLATSLKYYIHQTYHFLWSKVEDFSSAYLIALTFQLLLSESQARPSVSSELSPAPKLSIRMSETLQELKDIPQEFFKDGTQFINRCTKRMFISPKHIYAGLDTLRAAHENQKEKELQATPPKQRFSMRKNSFTCDQAARLLAHEESLQIRCLLWGSVHNATHAAEE